MIFPLLVINTSNQKIEIRLYRDIIDVQLPAKFFWYSARIIKHQRRAHHADADARDNALRKTRGKKSKAGRRKKSGREALNNIVTRHNDDRTVITRRSS